MEVDVTNDRYTQESPARLRRRASRANRSDAPAFAFADSGDVIRSVSQLAASWTKAGAHLFFDTVGVINELTSDVTDSVIDSVAPAIRTKPAATADDGSGRAAGDAAKTSRGPLLDQVNTSVSRALQDVSDVLSTSAAEMSRGYEPGPQSAATEASSARQQRGGQTSAGSGDPPTGSTPSR
jgi:hypothetical protein